MPFEEDQQNKKKMPLLSFKKNNKNKKITYWKLIQIEPKKKTKKVV